MADSIDISVPAPQLYPTDNTGSDTSFGFPQSQFDQITYTSHPRNALRNNPYASPTYTYPSDLGSVQEQPYIIFQIRESVINAPKILGTLALNIPSVLKSKYHMDYQDLSMGVDKALSLLNDLGRNPKANGLWAAGALADGSGLLENSAAKAEQLLGAAVNPHMACLFKAVGFREFQFDFTMMAKNAQESVDIDRIIKTFKFHMHPEAKEGITAARWLMYPNNFDIAIRTPSPDYLFKISTCALIDMDVDYGGTGIPTFFKDTGAPVCINVSLTFKELEILTRARIDQGF